jgi:putative Mg2+ transporter-C (MgtC) family protein
MTAIDSTEIALRLVAAVLIGSVVGINRELHEKPAGVRTHALVALGSAVVVIACRQLGTTPDHQADAMSRAIQGLVAGIGFLGGGVILRDPGGGRVQGLTTAAAIWVTALFGAACGVGAFQVVGFGVALMFVILTVGGPIERLALRIFHRRSVGSPPTSRD